MTRNVLSQTAQRAEPSDRPLTAYLPNFLPTFSSTSTQPSPQLSPNFLPNLNRPCLLTNMSIIWAELGLVRDLEFLLYPTNQQLQSPSLNPPVGIVLVFPPAPPPLKWLQLTCGWGESGVAWRESPVRLGPHPK